MRKRWHLSSTYQPLSAQNYVRSEFYQRINHMDLFNFYALARDIRDYVSNNTWTVHRQPGILDWNWNVLIRGICNTRRTKAPLERV